MVRTFLFIVLMTATISRATLALAQQAPSPQPVSSPATAQQPTAGSPPTSVSSSQPSAVTPVLPASPLNGPLTLIVPNPIKVESTLTGGGGGGSWSGWLTFFGVVVTAGVSGWVGYKTAEAAEQNRALTSELAMKEREVKVELARLELATKIDQFDKDLAEKKRQSDLASSTAKAAEQNKMSIEENRIAIELQRLGFQSGTAGNDAYLAATRFVHEQQIAEAELIRSFSDRLLSENERDSTFAIFVLSAYVSLEVIERLAAGGEKIIPTASLERLSRIDGYQISSIARSILEHRKANPEDESMMQKP
jgi:hypothetical protein